MSKHFSKPPRCRSSQVRTRQGPGCQSSCHRTACSVDRPCTSTLAVPCRPSCDGHDGHGLHEQRDPQQCGNVKFMGMYSIHAHTYGGVSGGGASHGGVTGGGGQQPCGGGGCGGLGISSIRPRQRCIPSWTELVGRIPHIAGFPRRWSVWGRRTVSSACRAGQPRPQARSSQSRGRPPAPAQPAAADAILRQRWWGASSGRVVPAHGRAVLSQTAGAGRWPPRASGRAE